MVKDFDRLSDQLCRVIDLCDFISNVHPSPAIQQAAIQAHSEMYEYMNVLNTTPQLESQLKKANSMRKVTESWSQEEKVTANSLLKDFEQSAISRPKDVRDRFIQLSNTIMQVGQDMTDRMAPAQDILKFSSSELSGMDPTVVKSLTRFGTTTLKTHDSPTRLALRTARDPSVRERIYKATRTASKPSIDRVEELIKARGELARLSGHDSFAHMTLSDKMAKNPEAVNQFLEMLALQNKRHVNSDLDELSKAKQSDPHTRNTPSREFYAWDRDYYSTLLGSNLDANTRMSSTLSSYFSLGSVIQGLSRLFNRLYGIRLVPRETPPGETWHDDVRRLDVIDESDGHIAVIYCDLFQRSGKSPNPAHYTLRCSREIFPSEIASAQASNTLSTSPTAQDLSTILNDGMSLKHDPRTGITSQLPTIAFICDFPTSPYDRPTHLSHTQLTTLFHEMGHCLHSILGRTSLQNVAGTRCATDFAELPSVLMEHFAASPPVLALLDARHQDTDTPLDVSLVASHLARDRRLRGAWDTETQIQLSVLDQRLHGPAIAAHTTPGHGPEAGFSTRIYDQVSNEPGLACVQEPPGTSWHGFFGHLFQYGGVYYSYLFDRAIAGRVWEDVFEGRALERAQGQLYKEQVLKWGGSRDGWTCVVGVLGEEKAWMREGGHGGDG